MHGIVMKGLRDFVVEQADRSTWRSMKADATDRTGFYVPIQEYPDEELYALVEAAVERLECSESTLLVDFGIFLMRSLHSTYHIYFDDSWTAMDVLENVETAIHESLRARANATFTPPKLRTKRLSSSAVAIEYGSDRELEPLAKGLILGIGEVYDQPLSIEQRSTEAGKTVFIVRRERITA